MAFESETVYKHPRGVLDATWALCQKIQTPPAERDLIKFVEQVYETHPPAEDAQFRDVQAAIRGHQDRLAGVLDSPRPQEDEALCKTRPEDYLQVSVIPSVFETQARACLPSERKRYELKVPLWYARGKNVDTDDLPICPMGYSHEFGAELLPADKHPEPGYEIL